jgi:hypothetical protein
MDHDRFDTLARQVFTSLRQSRRAALAALDAALLLANADVVLSQVKKRLRAKVAAQTVDRCFPGKNCNPGKGTTTSRCDFANTTLFRNKDVRGSNLSNSNFFAVDFDRGRLPQRQLERELFHQCGPDRGQAGGFGQSAPGRLPQHADARRHARPQWLRGRHAMLPPAGAELPGFVIHVLGRRARWAVQERGGKSVGRDLLVLPPLLPV